MLTRRRLVLGAGALAVTSGGFWYERRTPSPSSSVPQGTQERYVSGSFASSAMRSDLRWTIAYPSAPGPMPLLLHLHGRGGSHRDVRRYGPFLAEQVRRTGAPFAMVGVDGGDHSYYHRRASGEDPQRMLLDELLPVLARQGLRTDRFALGGVSMGGYGALLLAESLGPKRVTACVVDSPAIFASARDRAKGAFDSDDDFRAHDVVARASSLGGIPLRVTCGTSDPFLPGVRQLLARVPSAACDISKGGHNEAFWLHTAPAQVAFAGDHLSS